MFQFARGKGRETGLGVALCKHIDARNDLVLGHFKKVCFLGLLHEVFANDETLVVKTVELFLDPGLDHGVELVNVREVCSLDELVDKSRTVEGVCVDGGRAKKEIAGN